LPTSSPLSKHLYLLAKNIWQPLFLVHLINLFIYTKSQTKSQTKTNNNAVADMINHSCYGNKPLPVILSYLRQFLWIDLRPVVRSSYDISTYVLRHILGDILTQCLWIWLLETMEVIYIALEWPQTRVMIATSMSCTNWLKWSLDDIRHK